MTRPFILDLGRGILSAILVTSPLTTLGLDIPAPGSSKAAAEAKAAEEAKLKSEADAKAKAKAEADAKAKAEQQAKTKAEADAKAKADQQAKAKAEAEGRAKVAAEEKPRAKSQADGDAKAKAKMEADLKAAAEEKAKAELDARLAAEARSKAEADAKAVAEMRAKAEADAKAAADLRAKVQAEADARTNASKNVAKGPAPDSGKGVGATDGLWQLQMVCGPNSKNNQPGYSFKREFRVTDGKFEDQVVSNSQRGTATEVWQGKFTRNNLNVLVMGTRGPGDTWEIRFSGAVTTLAKVEVKGGLFNRNNEQVRDCGITMSR